MVRTIGILALQGDFARHIRMVEKLKQRILPVRWPRDLEACDGLIIPGGESTTFSKLLHKTGLFEAIPKFTLSKPVMGTCAGLITLSTDIINDGFDTLGLIDLRVERNGYGRQIDSFISPVRIKGIPQLSSFEGIFIRAPKIISIGDTITPLGYRNDEIVIVRNERILALTFHPELTENPGLHRYFLNEFVR